MATRIQIVLDELERERFRQAAAREGLSLSDWLRRAARDRLAAREPRTIESVEQLREFFAACDAREKGREPEWSEHLRVMDESRRQQAP